RSSSSELEQVGPHPAAHLEHPIAAVPLEPRHLAHPRSVIDEAEAGVLLEPLAGELPILGIEPRGARSDRDVRPVLRRTPLDVAIARGGVARSSGDPSRGLPGASPPDTHP